jgi:hypothetical protein
MTTSMLADFLSLGHEARGTQSLAVTKVDLFFQAVEGYLNSMADTFNRYAIPRLMELNGVDQGLWPKLKPDLAQRVDLDVLSNFILRIAQAGMPLFPDEDLQSYIKDAAGLPDIDDSRAMQAAGLTDDQLDLEDEKSQIGLEQQNVSLEQMKNPPDPATGKPNGSKPPPAKGSPRANLEKMIAKALAQRHVRLSGPRFGVRTDKIHFGKHQRAPSRRSVLTTKRRMGEVHSTR